MQSRGIIPCEQQALRMPRNPDKYWLGSHLLKLLISAKRCASYRIGWTAGISMRSTLPLTQKNAAIDHDVNLDTNTDRQFLVLQKGLPVFCRLLGLDAKRMPKNSLKQLTLQL